MSKDPNAVVGSTRSIRNLSSKEAAAYLCISPGTLSNWRVKGLGPRYLKLNGKVLYPMAEIHAFERGGLRDSTADGAS